MRKLAVILTAILALPPLAFPQDHGGLMGKVIDATTRKPLSYANVLIEGTDLWAVADLNGDYSMPYVPAGTYKVASVIIGYESAVTTVHVLSRANTRADFILEMSPISLDEIVVTATRTSHLLCNSPIPTEVAAQMQIRKYNVLDAGDAIGHMSGVRFRTSFAPMADDVTRIQGLPSSYTLIMVDGEKVRGRYALTQIPAEMLEKVEVVKGPSSVLYGSDAMGGVCNVVTKRIPENLSLATTLAFGSYDTRNASLAQGGSLGEFGYMLSAGVRRSKGEEGKRNWYDSEKALLKLRWEGRERSVASKCGYYHEDLSLREASKLDFGVEAKARFPGLSSLMIKGHVFDDRDETSIGGAVEATVTEEDGYRGEIQWTGPGWPGHIFTAGTGVSYNRIEGGDLSGLQTQSMGSFYIQDEILAEPFTFFLAGRFDGHSEWGSHLNPRLAVLYQPYDGVRIRASVGKAFKVPSFKDLYRKTWHGFGGGGFWIVGNPELKPERSVGLNAEVEASLSRVVHCKASGFRHDLRDMLQGAWVTPDSVYSYYNIGRASTWGCDVEMKAGLLFNGLTGTLRYGFLKTRDERTGKELTYSPHHRADAEVSYSHDEIGLELTVMQEYVTGSFEDIYNEERLPAYSVTGLRASMCFLEKARLFVTVDNIFGKEYRDQGFQEEKAFYTAGITLKLGAQEPTGGRGAGEGQR